MALFNTNAFRITEQGLSVLWQKQQIIAQNIANQDTPGYNCKYLDFYAVLKDRMESTSVVEGRLKAGRACYQSVRGHCDQHSAGRQQCRR